MAESAKEAFNPLFTNPLEAVGGMTISDLNRYLPALRDEKEIKMTIHQMEEGLFLTDGLTGLEKLPDSSIDLVVTDPPANPIESSAGKTQPMTLQDYYQWNEKWLDQSYRVLKNTGGLYLLCDWPLSSMYHGLIRNRFMVQTRITWRDQGQPRNPTWKNEAGDIWFATKSENFLFDLPEFLKPNLLLDPVPGLCIKPIGLIV